MLIFEQNYTFIIEIINETQLNIIIGDQMITTNHQLFSNSLRHFLFKLQVLEFERNFVIN